MSECKVHPSVAQRIIIKFLTCEGVKPSEILRTLQAQFPDNCLKKPLKVYEWHKQFQAGREAVENEPHDRRPRTSLTEQNIAAARGLIERNRRLTIMEIASEIKISYGSAESIIVDELGFRKISARWVPRLLTDQMKQNRLEVSQRLLERFQVDGENFVTCDETWVHHYTVESKQASMEWKKKGEVAPVKAKIHRSADKVVTTVFWDFKGILLIGFLHERRTVDAAYYCQVLDKAKLAYQSKRHGFLNRRVLLLHDNARPHTAALIQQKLEEIK